MTETQCKEQKYNPLDAMKLDYKHCFLCGVKMSEENVSDEHVFPKWIQHKFNLWDKSITLLNGTLIRYRDLKIPCCKKCNGEYLSNVEKTIGEAVRKGFDVFDKIDDDIVSRWLLKISYGMLFKELSLNVDRRDPNKGKIVSKEFIKTRNIVHILIQGIKHEMKFMQGKPWSIIKFKLHTNENENIFDCGDILLQNYFYIRMNDIGVIFCYGDNGIGKEMIDDYYGHYKNKCLHPIQFYEFCAKTLYKQELLVSSTKYLMIDNISEIEIYNSINNLIGVSHYEWNQYEYYKRLISMMKRSGYNVHIEFKEPDLVSTLLDYESQDYYILYNSVNPEDFTVHKK